MAGNYLNELYESINTTIAENGLEASFVEPEEAERLLVEISTVFDFSLNSIFPWDDVKKGSVVYKECPQETDIWKNYFAEFTADFEDRVFLAVSDTSDYPWPVLSCLKADAAFIILDQHYFEYFIFDAGMNKILFENHHDVLYRYTI